MQYINSKLFRNQHSTAWTSSLRGLFGVAEVPKVHPDLIREAQAGSLILLMAATTPSKLCDNRECGDPSLVLDMHRLCCD